MHTASANLDQLIAAECCAARRDLRSTAVYASCREGSQHGIDDQGVVRSCASKQLSRRSIAESCSPDSRHSRDVSTECCDEGIGARESFPPRRSDSISVTGADRRRRHGRKIETVRGSARLSTNIAPMPRWRASVRTCDQPIELRSCRHLELRCRHPDTAAAIVVTIRDRHVVRKLTPDMRTDAGCTSLTASASRLRCGTRTARLLSPRDVPTIATSSRRSESARELDVDRRRLRIANPRERRSPSAVCCEIGRRATRSVRFRSFSEPRHAAHRSARRSPTDPVSAIAARLRQIPTREIERRLAPPPHALRANAATGTEPVHTRHQLLLDAALQFRVPPGPRRRSALESSLTP